jgi:hypothetical protein
MNLDESTAPLDLESAYESAEQEGRTTGVPLLGVLLPGFGVLLPVFGPLEGPLLGPLLEGLVGTFPLLLVLVFPGVVVAGGMVLVLGPLEGPLFGLLLGLTLGLLGPLEGPLLGPLFEGLVGTFPLLLVFPGVFGLAGGVVVAGGRPGTPRPLREESNIG